MKKPSRRLQQLAALRRQARLGRFWAGVTLLAAGTALQAADSTNSVPKVDPLTPAQQYEGGEDTYNNWVELGGGDVLNSGNHAQAQQNTGLNTGGFGGLADAHLEKQIAKKTTLSIDGRYIPENHDYHLGVGVANDDLGFIRFSYENFRVYDSGNGGFSPVDGIAYPNNGNALALDRGNITVEALYNKDGKPRVDLKYTHTYRDGEEGSTIWGEPPANTAANLRLYPTTEVIHDTSDAVQLDVSKQIKTTTVGVGGRFETGQINNADLIYSFPSLVNPTQNQKVTDSQGTSYDMESVHAFSETWLKDNLFVSSGFMFENLDNIFSGSRIYGDDFDVLYSPAYPANYYGYYNLNGGSHQNEYVVNLNFLSLPTKNNNFTIAPSLRVQKEDWNANSTEMATGGTLPADGQAFDNSSAYNTIDVRERLEVRYTGVTNWVFSTTGDLTEGQGSLDENGGITQLLPGAPDGQGPAPVQFSTDDKRFFQKYALNARWYPTRRIVLDFGGYYKNNRYNYDNTYDNTPNNAGAYSSLYPGFLVYQGFQTWDGSTRLTLRPLSDVMLVSRYEYQHSTIDTSPDGASGLGEVESARMDSQIVGQNISWTPLTWLCLQGGANYVWSETKTPESDSSQSIVTQSILNSQNNYWTVNASAGLILDDKTDLNLGYYYYRAADGQDTLVNGLPLGTDAEQNNVSATLTRRITKHLRWNVKYAFTHYDDFASAGAYNFNAQMIYTSLQYRF